MYRILICGALALLSAAVLAADELVLADGSRLLGQIQRIDDDVVVLETNYAGTLEVAREAVLGMTTAAARRVVLQDGAHFIGRLEHDPENGQAVTVDATNRVALDIGAIVAVQDPAAPLAEAGRPAAEPEPDTTAWSSTVSLAVDGASGNTDEFSATPRFSARRETDAERLKLDLQGRFAGQDGEETENEIIASAALERDFSERWFALGALRLERDELEDLDLRANLDFGVGYFVIRQDHHEFKPRAGLGFQFETFSEGSGDNQDLVGVAGWDYRYDLNQRWRFTHVLDYRPTFSEPFGQYRIDSEAALVTQLNDNRWGLSLLLRNEFNADPAPGVDELDTIYSVGLQRTFE